MKREELSKLWHLNREIEAEKRRLSELKAAAESTTSNVSGLPHLVGNLRHSEEVTLALAEAEKLVADKIRESVREYDRLIRFIASVDDPLVRQVLRLRFVDGLRWSEVARSIGGGNTPDSARMLCQRFLDAG